MHTLIMPIDGGHPEIEIFIHLHRPVSRNGLICMALESISILLGFSLGLDCRRNFSGSRRGKLNLCGRESNV